MSIGWGTPVFNEGPSPIHGIHISIQDIKFLIDLIERYKIGMGHLSVNLHDDDGVLYTEHNFFMELLGYKSRLINIAIQSKYPEELHITNLICTSTKEIEKDELLEKQHVGFIVHKNLYRPPFYSDSRPMEDFTKRYPHEALQISYGRDPFFWEFLYDRVFIGKNIVGKASPRDISRLAILGPEIFNDIEDEGKKQEQKQRLVSEIEDNIWL